MHTLSIARHRPALATLIVAALLLAVVAPVAAAPLNDEITGATPIGGLPFSDAADTGGATPALDDPACGGGPTVWYALTLNTSTSVTANTFGSDYDTTLGVYTGSPGALAQVACNDDYFGTTSRVQFEAVAGETYYLMAGAYAGGPGGNLTFTVDTAPPPLSIDLQDSVSARVVPKTGIATLSGTVTCSRPTLIDLSAYLQQRAGRATITGGGYTPIECTGTTSWSLTIVGANGRFVGGRASFHLTALAYDPDAEAYALDWAEGTVRLQAGR